MNYFSGQAQSPNPQTHNWQGLVSFLPSFHHSFLPSFFMAEWIWGTLIITLVYGQVFHNCLAYIDWQRLRMVTGVHLLIAEFMSFWSGRAIPNLNIVKHVVSRFLFLFFVFWFRCFCSLLSFSCRTKCYINKRNKNNHEPVSLYKWSFPKSMRTLQ